VSNEISGDERPLVTKLFGASSLWMPHIQFQLNEFAVTFERSADLFERAANYKAVAGLILRTECSKCFTVGAQRSKSCEIQSKF
jgi:hypothetical protein